VIDHVALEVGDLAVAARFYDALMRPLGGRRIVDSPDGIGYGRDRPELWLVPRANGAANSDGAPAPRGHVAIVALGRRAVDAAHEAGLAAGGRDAGPPEPRPFGPPSYYSGYLVDPDGARLELVSGSR
jgi:catechol 2,3-dioxygenase-like lactoylglutathione lyase family enzyme